MVVVDEMRLEQMLTRLHLTGLRDRLDSLLDEAARADLNLREALYFLCEQDVTRRDERRITMATKIAHFPYVRTFEGFDYEAQPSVDAGQIRELATCRWVANGDALLMLGPPGVGKSHLAVALGREAIKKGYTVSFTTATALMTMLVKANQEDKLEAKLSGLCKARLLIIDELGYLPFESFAAHLFFQLVSQRYERGSILIPSNRAVNEWGEVFGDSVVATAILDRLLHHSHILTIREESYRMRENRRSGLVKTAALTTANDGSSSKRGQN